MTILQKLKLKFYSKKTKNKTKEIYALTLRIYIKNIMSEESAKLLFVTFNCHHKFHFSGKFHWNLSSLSEDMNFYYFNYYRQFHGFFYLYLIQRTNDLSIYKIISSAFWPGIISDMLLKNCIKLHLYWISSSSDMKFRGGWGEGHNDPPRINHLQSPALEP